MYGKLIGMAPVTYEHPARNCLHHIHQCCKWHWLTSLPAQRIKWVPRMKRHKVSTINAKHIWRVLFFPTEKKKKKVFRLLYNLYIFLAVHCSFQSFLPKEVVTRGNCTMVWTSEALEKSACAHDNNQHNSAMWRWIEDIIKTMCIYLFQYLNTNAAQS